MTSTFNTRRQFPQSLKKHSGSMHVNSHTKFTLATPIAHVFGVDIKPMYSHISFKTCYRLTYFITEMIRITRWLLRKDLCEITQ